MTMMMNSDLMLYFHFSWIVFKSAGKPVHFELESWQNLIDSWPGVAGSAYRRADMSALNMGREGHANFAISRDTTSCINYALGPVPAPPVTCWRPWSSPDGRKHCSKLEKRFFMIFRHPKSRKGDPSSLSGTTFGVAIGAFWTIRALGDASVFNET